MFSFENKNSGKEIHCALYSRLLFYETYPHGIIHIKLYCFVWLDVCIKKSHSPSYPFPREMTLLASRASANSSLFLATKAKKFPSRLVSSWFFSFSFQDNHLSEEHSGFHCTIFVSIENIHRSIGLTTN